MGIQKCQRCGVEIQVMRSSRKWCDKCKLLQRRLYVQRYEHHQREINGQCQPHSMAKCLWCGNDFVAMRSDAKTCSTECKCLANLSKARRFEQSHRGVCQDCGVTTARRSTRCKPCSEKLRIDAIRGPKNYAWKGGRVYDHYGYVLVLVAPEQRKGHRYRREHILVWEAAHGMLPQDWIVHHINGIKDDNRLANLEAMPRKRHNHRHSEHDKRIQELEAENARLWEQLGKLGEKAI